MPYYSTAQLERFMRESNAIEGEVETSFVMTPAQIQWGSPIGKLHPRDLEVAGHVVALAERQGPLTREELCSWHAKLGEYLDEPWVGEYRTCDVRVGKHFPPSWMVVPRRMTTYLKAFPELDSWEAHNRFELIHPFQDLNGRTGRLIWLYKATQERLPLNLSFLHRYYYQTLSHHHDGNS